tara:strand:+ start:22777 stop:23004 length:228 start_codon:yes stop_codon:yes gene_type:complete
MDEELTLLLKELVDRIKTLETTVFNADNVLLKSGLVKVEGMKPSIQTASRVPSADTIAKMDWKEIDELVVKMSGE